MFSLDQYREDPEKQKNGTPIYFGDTVFYIRRWGTPESIKVQKQISENLFGPLHKWTPEDESLLIAHWLVEYGIANWDGVSDKANGDIIPYSKQSARGIFLNPELFLSLNIELFNDTKTFSNFLYDAADEDVEVLKKN
jgi:hypothetical protein